MAFAQCVRAAAVGLCLMALSGPAFAQGEAVRLRADVTAAGPLITLGDLFDNAGPAASRPVAPAPRNGATATLLPRVVERAARAAGLDWTAPDGLRIIEVRSPGAPSQSPRTASTSSTGIGAPIIRKGDLVTLAYNAPGVRITVRTRAQTEAAAGAPVQLTNLQSNRTIDAIATAPGRASANFDNPPTE
jgi:flagellar basal body P-ring formation protein FlgA